jgi:exonuclease SbcD
MKFLIIGDVHFRGVNPRARLDNYIEAISRKLHEVFAIAQQHRVLAIICPGDLLDSPATGWSTVAELAQILQGSPCPFLCINGNHDIYAGNPGSKYRTPFGFLARLGIIQDLGEEPFGPEDGDMDVLITGHGFNIETDTELGKGQFNPGYGKGSLPGIHVVHSMLMDHSPGFDMRHTLISQVETTAQVIICGHLHTGFGNSYIYRRDDDGVLFINPGALCRLSAHATEIERTVQIALLTVENGQAEAELIPLKSAAPGHEVLSRAHLEAEAERSERLERFLNLLASEGEVRFLETREIIDEIAARENILGEVKVEALKRIARAREELGAA